MLSLAVVLTGILSIVSLHAGDFSSPNDAWLPAPDGVTWPEVVAEVKFVQQAFKVVDHRIGGILDEGLEGPAPEWLRVAWIDLNSDGEDELFYIDKALSGTGGRYIRIVTRVDTKWGWIGEDLCERLELVEHSEDGWNSLSCTSQRALQHQRSLLIYRNGRYCSVRGEIHDLEHQTVKVFGDSCNRE